MLKYTEQNHNPHFYNTIGFYFFFLQQTPIFIIVKTWSKLVKSTCVTFHRVKFFFLNPDKEFMFLSSCLNYGKNGCMYAHILCSMIKDCCTYRTCLSMCRTFNLIILSRSYLYKQSQKFSHSIKLNLHYTIISH